MGVGAGGVEIEKVGHAELAEAEFEAAARKFVEERERSALVLDFVFAQREDFVEHAASEIGGFAEKGIADDVEIGVSGEAEAGTERGAAGFFDVGEKFSGIVQAVAGVERQDSGRGFFVVGLQAVRAGVERRGNRDAFEK